METKTCEHCGGRVYAQWDYAEPFEGVERCMMCGREPSAKEQTMTLPAKKCARIQCGKLFTPTSNRQRVCPECKAAEKDTVWDRRRAAAAAGTAKPETPAPQAAGGGNGTGTGTGTVTLDFTSYPSLLNDIKQRAVENFRPLELQIMYELQADRIKQ